MSLAVCFPSDSAAVDWNTVSAMIPAVMKTVDVDDAVASVGRTADDA